MSCLHLVPNTGDELTRAARSASGPRPHLRLVANNGSRLTHKLDTRRSATARRHHSWSSLLTAVGAFGAAVSLMVIGYAPYVSLEGAAAHLPIASLGPDPFDEVGVQSRLFHSSDRSPATTLSRSDTR